MSESRYEELPLATDAAVPGAPDWSNFVSGSGEAGTFVTPDDVKALRLFDSVTGPELESLLRDGDNARNLGRAVLNVCTAVSRAPVLVYVLDLVQRALIPDLSTRAEALFGEPTADLLSGAVEPEDGLHLQAGPIVNLTGNSNVQVQSLALYISALLISVGTTGRNKDADRKTVLTTALNLINGQPDQRTLPALQSLAVLLRSGAVRNLFAEQGAITVLTSTLDRFNSLGTDAQYQAALSLWVACFSPTISAQVDQAVLSTLVAVVRAKPMMRVVRLVLSTIRVVLSQDEDREKILCEAVIELKLPKILADIADSKLMNDVELHDDVEWLQQTLARNFKVLTTFERHEQELLSKRLNWTMIHEEIFWKENAHKFEHNNFSSIHRLIDLLDSEDPKTVAVACSDVGYFVQYFPNGKLIVDKYGGKQKVMALLQSSEPEVRKQALTACSKIMINNWESFKSK